MTELLGYTRDELVGKSAVMIRPESEEDEKKGKEFVEKLFENSYVRDLNWVWQKKDGTLIDVEINAALLRDEEGKKTVINVISATFNDPIPDKFFSQQNMQRVR